MSAIEIHAASDVTSECLSAAETIHDGYYIDQRVDWLSFWDRLEEYGWSIIDMDSPAAAKIQRHVRRLRASP